jgi:hypothetical protein
MSALFQTRLGNNDVLLGRGTGPNEHEGNKTFRVMAADLLKRVDGASNHISKFDLARELVAMVHSKKGRFVRKLTRDEVTAVARDAFKTSDKKLVKRHYLRGLYVVVPEDVAIEKAKQSFRHQLLLAVSSSSGESQGDLKRPLPCFMPEQSSGFSKHKAGNDDCDNDGHTANLQVKMSHSVPSKKERPSSKFLEEAHHHEKSLGGRNQVGNRGVLFRDEEKGFGESKLAPPKHDSKTPAFPGWTTSPLRSPDRLRYVAARQILTHPCSHQQTVSPGGATARMVYSPYAGVVVKGHHSLRYLSSRHKQLLSTTDPAGGLRAWDPAVSNELLLFSNRNLPPRRGLSLLDFSPRSALKMKTSNRLRFLANRSLEQQALEAASSLSSQRSAVASSRNAFELSPGRSATVSAERLSTISGPLNTSSLTTDALDALFRLKSSPVRSEPNWNRTDVAFGGWKGGGLDYYSSSTTRG